MTKPHLLRFLPFLKGSGSLQILHSCPILIDGLVGLLHLQHGFKATIRSPEKGVLREISHRSRYAVPPARKEMVKQFYLGDLITPIFGESSQIPKALSIVDSLPSVCVRTWQSTPFNAASTANGACHGNSLVRESAAFIRAIRQLKVELKEML